MDATPTRIITASTFAATVTYPLDTMRALRMGSAGTKADIRQAFGGFNRVYGAGGFMTQGIGPEILVSGLSRLVFLSSYPLCHQAITGGKKEHNKAFTSGMAGALASIPQALAVTPLEVAKIGVQLDKGNQFQNSGREVLQKVFREKGVQGLYMGWMGLQYRYTAWGAVYFGSLNTCIKAFGGNGRRSAFVGGVFAGLLGAAVSVPGDVVRTYVQKGELFGGNKGGKGSMPFGIGAFNSHSAAVRSIIEVNGMGGLWRGYGAKSAHMAWTGAILAVLIPYFTP